MWSSKLPFNHNHTIVQQIETKPEVDITRTFTYHSNKPISKFTKSCSCTSFDFKNNILTINVGHSELPHPKYQLNKQVYDNGVREYNKNVSVTVHYEDETTTVFQLQIKVKE